MTLKNSRKSLRLGLLVATCLTASPVLAQEQSVDERLDRLEALVEGLIERLDKKETTTQAEQEAMRQTAAAALAATRDLETKQAELAAQIES